MIIVDASTNEITPRLNNVYFHCFARTRVYIWRQVVNVVKLEIKTNKETKQSTKNTKNKRYNKQSTDKHHYFDNFLSISMLYQRTACEYDTATLACCPMILCNIFDLRYSGM